MCRTAWTRVVVATCLALFPTSSDALTCGQSVTANTVMTANLMCSDTSGLILGAPGITLDMAGYEIRCVTGSSCASGTNGELAGVVLAASNTTVKGPGRITGFLAG